MNTAIAQASDVIGSQASLARLLGVTPATISQWLIGLRSVPPERCPEIERAAEGRVTVEQLRPDVRWQRVPDPAWPHPDGRPCIDVARPVEVSDAA